MRVRQTIWVLAAALVGVLSAACNAIIGNQAIVYDGDEAGAVDPSSDARDARAVEGTGGDASAVVTGGVDNDSDVGEDASFVESGGDGGVFEVTDAGSSSHDS